MSQQDRMRLLLPAPPSLVSWTLEPGICRQNGNGEDGAPVRRTAKTTCRRGGTVSPATTNFEELTFYRDMMRRASSKQPLGAPLLGNHREPHP